MLPCVIRESKDADDDKIALITANATARDLTDGERLAQYEALKEVLTRKKSFGQLQGKGGIAVIILAGNDTDVIVLRGIRGVVHQFILGNATLDSHLLIQGGIGCFTIITGELQAIIQCSYRMRMAIAAIIGNTGHRRLCSDH